MLQIQCNFVYFDNLLEAPLMHGMEWNGIENLNWMVNLVLILIVK